MLAAAADRLCSRAIKQLAGLPYRHSCYDAVTVTDYPVVHGCAYILSVLTQVEIVNTSTLWVAVRKMHCSKIAEAEAAVSVNEKKWLVMHMHVQLQLDELRGPQTLGSL
jgi:hypothetical protein